MGQFEKGHKKLGGRKAGVPNKSTQEIREAFDMLIRSNVGNFTLWLEQVAEKNPAKALEIVSNMAEYIVPKLSRTEIKADIDKKVTFNITKSYDSDKETD